MTRGRRNHKDCLDSGELSLSVVSSMLKMGRKKVKELCQGGHIKAINKSMSDSRPEYVIKSKDLMKFMESRNLPIPFELSFSVQAVIDREKRF